jgi:hypothetical protein
MLKKSFLDHMTKEDILLYLSVEEKDVGVSIKLILIFRPCTLLVFLMLQ